MNLLRASRRAVLAGLLGVGLTLPSATLRGHEPTRAAHEAALDPCERVVLLNAANLRVVNAAPRDAASCALTLRLVDAETKQPLAGLVRVKRADGTAVPLAGLVNRGTKLRNNHPAKEWFALVERAMVALPREALTIEAIGSLETELAHVTVDLRNRDQHELTVPMMFFDRPAPRGWRNGNTHLHLQGLTRAQADDYLHAIPRADGLEVLFVSYLERAVADRDYISNKYSLADLREFERGGVLFGNGQEHRHNFEGFGAGYGHVMFLNISKLVQPVSIGRGIMKAGPDWPPLQRGVRAARADGATVVWCHNTFGHEDVPNWLAGLVHAHNIFDGGMHGGYEDTYYRFLNAGLRVPFSTGTDWFIYDFARTHARVDGPLTHQSWLAALAAGRTFIGNGPLLELRAGTNDIGDTVKLAKPGPLKFIAHAKGRGDFQRVELIHDGKPVQAATTRAVGGHFEAELEHTVNFTESGWVALRVQSGSLPVGPDAPARPSGPKNEMGEPLFGHTSAIYVEIAGKPIFKPAAARELVADMEGAVQDITAKGQFDNPAQRDEVLKVYHEGIATLRKRLSTP
ncbi:MAG: CehA/McbA family metallohydrolase [Limisphaerales bacterium]